MSFAPSSTYFKVGDGSIIGMFIEKEVGNLFEYSKNDDPLFVNEGFPHKIWVTTARDGIDHGFRYGLVKKTVAYIVTDEDEFGLPVVEKWVLKNNVEYVER
jgi:hypothetical protein